MEGTNGPDPLSERREEVHDARTQGGNGPQRGGPREARKFSQCLLRDKGPEMRWHWGSHGRQRRDCDGWRKHVPPRNLRNQVWSRGHRKFFRVREPGKGERRKLGGIEECLGKRQSVTVSSMDISMVVTYYLSSWRKFTVLNSPKGFWRSLPEISLLYFFFSSSANLKTWLPNHWCPFPFLFPFTKLNALQAAVKYPHSLSDPCLC